MNKLAAKQYLAIDSWTLLLPARVYASLVDKFHPHEPKVADVVKILKSATPAEQKEIAARTAEVVACIKVMEEATAASK